MKLEIEVSTETLQEIMIGAIESAIGYWGGTDNRPQEFKADSMKDLTLGEKVFEIIHSGGGVTIYDIEDDDEWVLTYDKFISGLKQHGNYYFDYMDDNDYDCILQYALFNEIVFG